MFGTVRTAPSEGFTLNTNDPPLWERLCQELDHLGLEPSLGVELEGQIPKNVGLRSVAENLCAALSSTAVVSRIDQSSKEEYLIGAPEASRFNRWRVESEKTVSPDPEFESLEIVSPTLTSQRAFDEFRSIWEHLSRWGFVSYPRGAGLHFHLGWPTPKPLEVLAFRLLIGSLESDLLRHFTITPDRLQWLGSGKNESALMHTAKKIYAEALKSQDTKKSGWLTFLDAVNDPHTKSYNNKKSLTRLTPFGTLEFRAPNSTLDFAELEKSLLLFVKLFAYSQKNLSEVIGFLAY